MAEVKLHLCSEELPEKDGEYLTMIRYYYSDGSSDITTIAMPFATGEDGGWNCGSDNNKHRITNVYAWADISELRKEALEL